MGGDRLFAKEHLVDGYSRPLVSEPHSFYIGYGRGCWAIDVDGNKRIDFINNFGALIHGYSHRKKSSAEEPSGLELGGQFSAIGF